MLELSVLLGAVVVGRFGQLFACFVPHNDAVLFVRLLCRSRVCFNRHGMVRKYGLNMCRQCFRERAALIGFQKVRGRPHAHFLHAAKPILWQERTCGSVKYKCIASHLYGRGVVRLCGVLQYR